MANPTGSPRRIWFIPVAVLIIGAACTYLLWHSVERALLQSSQNQAVSIHEAARLHLASALARNEALAATLAQSLADSTNPQVTLSQSGELLLQRFPELIAIERYAAGAGPGPDSWRQVQLIARGTAGGPDRDFRPATVPHWQAVIERAWRNLQPGTTSLAAGSGALSEAISSRPTVHLFWPAVQSEADADATNGPAQAMPQLLGLMLDPEQLLAALPGTMPGADIEFRIFDLDSQSADPIAKITGAKAIGTSPMPERPPADGQLVFEDTVSLTDREWLLRTTFGLQVPTATQGLLQAILVFGAALTLLTALLCQRLASHIRHQTSARAKTLRRWKSEHLAVQNAAIEKAILSRALNDSDQRTRDFIDLSDAFSCELDEEWRIGFVSSQIAGILDRPPVDLADRSVLELLPESDRERVADALRRSERERQTLRIETVLLQPDGRQCPVFLSIRPVCDGTNRCLGFRAVGWRR